MISAQQTEKVDTAIRALLLEELAGGKNGAVAAYGDGAYVAYTTLDMDAVRAKAECLQADMTKCLLEHGALNIAEVHIGAFFAFEPFFWVLTFKTGAAFVQNFKGGFVRNRNLGFVIRVVKVAGTFYRNKIGNGSAPGIFAAFGAAV